MASSDSESDVEEADTIDAIDAIQMKAGSIDKIQMKLRRVHGEKRICAEGAAPDGSRFHVVRKLPEGATASATSDSQASIRQTMQVVQDRAQSKLTELWARKP